MIVFINEHEGVEVLAVRPHERARRRGTHPRIGVPKGRARQHRRSVVVARDGHEGAGTGGEARIQVLRTGRVAQQIGDTPVSVAEGFPRRGDDVGAAVHGGGKAHRARQGDDLV